MVTVDSIRVKKLLPFIYAWSLGGHFVLIVPVRQGGVARKNIRMILFDDKPFRLVVSKLLGRASQHIDLL